MERGEKIWVESLMTPQEWKERYKTYPTSSVEHLIPEFDCEFKWRKGIGTCLKSEEIQLINSRIDEILKKVKKNAQV